MLDHQRWTINMHNTRDGSKIRVARYNRTDDVERYIVFINGHGEFLEKYSYLPEDLKVPPKYGFITWDHRGQGASDGQPRLHIDDYEIFSKDAAEILKSYVGNKPYDIIAHSMGGLITLHATMKSYISPQKILLSAPLLGIQHVIPPSIAKYLSRFCTWLGLGRKYFQEHLQLDKNFAKNMFTHSKERFEQRFKSPYKIEGITFGWINATFKALEFVHEASLLKTFQVPTKILYGDDERLVSKSAIENWVEKTGANTSCLELKNTRHEIFAEEPQSYNTVLQHAHEFLTIPQN